MALDDLSVDIMEVRFATSSERETLKKIMDAGTDCTVCSLAKSVRGIQMLC